MKKIWKDEMTPKERLKAFAAGEAIDRIPCMPLISDQAYGLAGGPLSVYYHSAEKMAEAQIRVFETCETDSVGTSPGLFGLAEALGTRLEFPDNSVPYVAEPVLKSYEQLTSIPHIDPAVSGRLPVILDALQRIQAEAGERSGVGCSVSGPLTTAAAMRGTENLLRDMVRNPEGVHQLLAFATENALIFIDALHRLGIKPSIAEPTGSGSLISAAYFRTFSKPYMQRYAQHIAKLFGGPPFIHICGDTTKIWEDIVEVGCSVLSLDNQIDLAEAKQRVGAQVCLAGNVPPYTFWKGSREDIAASVKECLAKAYDNPKGYVVSSGCGLPIGAPADNITAMMDAVRIFGKWPLNPELFQ